MLHPAANSHPEATHQWLLMGRLNNPLAMHHPASNGRPKATSRKHFPWLKCLKRPPLSLKTVSNPYKTLKTLQTLKVLPFNSFKRFPRSNAISAAKATRKATSRKHFPGMLLDFHLA